MLYTYTFHPYTYAAMTIDIHILTEVCLQHLVGKYQLCELINEGIQTVLQFDWLISLALYFYNWMLQEH